MIIPIIYDQHDNAERMQRMGVAVIANRSRNLIRLMLVLKRCLNGSEMPTQTTICIKSMREQRRPSQFVSWNEESASRSPMPINS